MPSTVGTTLNKRIHSAFTPLEFQQAVIPVSAYTVKVSQPLGVSLTGWEAQVQLNDNTDVNPLNGLIVEMLENISFPTDQPSITALLSSPQSTFNSVFFIGVNDSGQYFGAHRQYQSPFQMRYGISYSIYVRGLFAAVITDIFVISLTVFGFENADQTQPVIQLR